MDSNSEIRNPEIVVEWDVWNQTWLFNKIMRSSKKFQVKSVVELQPGSITLVLKVLSTTADILGISSFIKSVADYIRMRREKEDLPPPKKNQDSAYFEARGHLSIEMDVIRPSLVSSRRVDNGYEFIFKDEFNRSHHFIIFDDCSYKYETDLSHWEEYFKRED